MIISRTPFRISFFGGGTDYHPWYQQYGGAVLATTINHYCYLTCRFLPPFFDHRSKIIWSKIEEVNHHADIQHPAVNAILDYLKIEGGIEIHHQGDLPARSGLGSSSTFTVGLLNALYAYQGQMSSKRNLACEAVHIEREVLKENVGVQDQIQTAYGGFNKIIIESDGNFHVDPVILPAERLHHLQENLLLFFTGISRHSSKIAEEQIAQIPNNKKTLHAMHQMIDDALAILQSDVSLDEFGRLLHETWLYKRSIATSIAPPFVDDIYQRATTAGALGGKILGAGGGGFMLFYVQPEKRQQVLDALSELLMVPFQFERSGSQIIFYDDQQFSLSSHVRRDYRHLNQTQTATTRPMRKNKLTIINH